jgi:membrane protein DedA with SNARE-associated domain
MHGLVESLHHLIAVWFGWVRDGGYPAIVALMAMESSIFPVPSEIVIPPAAFYVAEGKMTFWGVVLAGTFGSWLGSAITYAVSRWLGRLFIVRFGKYFLISEAKLALAERWIHQYEAGGIFFARLLPVIRHLISIPAGIIRMGFGMFSAMTVIGSFLWCLILAWLGEQARIKEPGLLDPAHPEKMITFIKGQSHWIILGVLVLAVLYFLVLKLTNKSAAKASSAALE